MPTNSTTSGSFLPGTLVNSPVTCRGGSASLSPGVTSGSLVNTSGQPVCGGTVVVGDVTAGVEAIQVGETTADGVVTFQGGGSTSVSMEGGTVTISTQGSQTGATHLYGLLDVAISHVNGVPDAPAGSHLRLETFESGKFWTPSTTIDGGSYL